jgi:ATP-dependent protease ClpP protease subunit
LKTILVTVLVMASVLMSGLVQIHFEHHVNLPSLDKSKITVHYSVDTTLPFIHKTVDIRLDDSIRKINVYKDIADIIHNASPNTTIRIFLSGYGGNADGTMYIINSLVVTKAQVETHVVGSVYSAHAYIASLGKKIIMYPLSSLMFHDSSALNIDCSKHKGRDRGMSNEEHCKLFVENALNISMKMIMAVPILTIHEKTLILMGQDVYLTPEQLEGRSPSVTVIQ